MKDDLKEYDLESLSAFNGKDGRPVYIAHKGKVYDVSASKMWKAGQHMKRHDAGRDLTTDIQAAPHDTDVLERYPQVGILKKIKESEKPYPESLSNLLERFPVLRRHPHPMLVHFPIVFMIAPVLFLILSLVFNLRSFETTAFHCLGAGIFFLIPAMLTGFFTWWLNYSVKPMRPVKIKINVSFILLTVSVIAFVWRGIQPDVFSSFTGWGVIYFMLVVLLVPIVSIIGWFGATLSFPLDKD